MKCGEIFSILLNGFRCVVHLREREVDFTLPLLRLAFPLAQPSERVASRSKQKGDRDERGLIANLADHDIDAHRVPLSGAVEG